MKNSGNYIDKLLTLFRNNKPFFQGRHAELKVLHDEHCAIFRNGLCDCDPDVQIMRVWSGETPVGSPQ